MAPESCNLGKDESDTLKPSSPPSSSASPPPSNPSATSSSSQLPQQQSPSCLLLKSTQVFEAQREETAALLLPKVEEGLQRKAQFGHRCSTCQKRVGLTGFRCRCGDLFCARHRYSDTHDCSFDYKAAGREEISKANPVIRAAKIIKI